MSAELIGLEGLKRKFQALDRRAQGRTLRQSLMKGAIIIRNAARAKAPVRTGDTRTIYTKGRTNPRRPGNLRKNIVIKRRRPRRGGPRMMTLGIGPSRDAYYGIVVEFGYGRQAPQPFLRPAFDEQKGTAFEAIAAQLRKALLDSVKA